MGMARKCQICVEETLYSAYKAPFIAQCKEKPQSEMQTDFFTK